MQDPGSPEIPSPRNGSFASLALAKPGAGTATLCTQIGAKPHAQACCRCGGIRLSKQPQERRGEPAQGCAAAPRPGKPSPWRGKRVWGQRWLGTQGPVGCSPHQGDPTGAAMWGSGETEGGPGKLPMELVLHKPWASRRGLSPAAVPAARGPETPLGPAHPQGRWEKEQSRNRLLQPLTFKAHALPLFRGEALLGENDCPGLAKCCSQSSRYGEQGTVAGKHIERVTWDRPLERGGSVAGSQHPGEVLQPQLEGAERDAAQC